MGIRFDGRIVPIHRIHTAWSNTPDLERKMILQQLGFPEVLLEGYATTTFFYLPDHVIEKLIRYFEEQIK